MAISLLSSITYQLINSYSKNMGDSYLTISGSSQGVVREKMSRFLAFAHPVSDAAQARVLVKHYQNEYHDARHVCWAYMLGADRAEYQSNDNGEPSGTAGRPILGQINSFNLTDVIGIVVRYFGGIKLGTSGLTAAYREAMRLALADAEIVECHSMVRLQVLFSYFNMDAVMRVVKGMNLQVESRVFDNSCTLELSVRKGKVDEIRSRLKDYAIVNE